MADSRSIVITLKLDKSSDDVSEKPTSTESASSSSSKDSTSKAVAAWAAEELVKRVVQEGVAWGEYYWDRSLQLNDDYIGQRDKQIATAHINGMTNAISTIAGYTAQGAMIGGWAGALVGAFIGTAVTVSGIGRQHVTGSDQQNIMLRQMDAQLQFTRSRAGWSTSAGSIGEDL